MFPSTALLFARRLALRAGMATIVAVLLMSALAAVAPVAPDTVRPLTGVDVAAAGCTDGDSLDSGIMAANGDQTWTGSTVLKVYTTRGLYEASSAYCTNNYWFLVPVTGAYTAAQVRSSGVCGRVVYIGAQQWMSPGFVAPTFDFNFNACESATQGGHAVSIGLMTCTSNPGTSPYTWNPVGWLNARASCTQMVAVDQDWINYDSVAPNTPVVSPTSTMYTSATSGTVTWTSGDPAPSSGITNHQVAYRWSPLSDGACNSWGAWTYGWVGAGNSWGPGWGSNTCFQYAISAQDRVGLMGPWGYSAAIISDQLSPTVGGHISATSGSASVETCFSPGQTLHVVDGGSSDTRYGPSSGWPWGGGMWYYYNNGAAASGWIAANTRAYAVPTPAVGSQGNYVAQMYIRDNVGNYENRGTNQSAVLTMPYNVDNSNPTNATLAALPPYTGSTTHNLSFSATGGGCKGVDQVAISNNGANWLYSGYTTSYANWDITNTAYGGSTAQGNRTVHVAFRERGTNNWTYVTRSFIYDGTPPTSSASVVSGTGGLNGWYVTPVTVRIDSIDDLSGFNMGINSPTINNLVRFPTSGTASYTASSSYNGNYTPERAADGDENDGWAPLGYNPGQWWQVNFSVPQTLDTIRTVTRIGGEVFGNATISFSDGSSIGGLYMGGNREVDLIQFAAKSGISWFRITSNSGGAQNPGFAEVSGFNTAAADLGVIKYRINGGSVITCAFVTCGQANGSLSLSLDFPSDGIYTINYWALDVVGNTEGTHTLTVKVDMSPPIGCMITAVDETTATTVDVTLSGCTDPLGVVDGARFGDEVGYNWNNAYANIGWVDYSGGTIIRSVTLESGSGDYRILIQVRDEAGNMVFFDTSTTVNTTVNYPVLGAGAYIYECGTAAAPAGQPDNTTGTIFWTVDQPLCLVPHITQITPGTRTVGGRELTSRVIDPVISYTLLADPNDPRGGLVYPTGFVGQARGVPPAALPLQFAFTRETSGMAQALPVLIVPVQVTAEIGWFNTEGVQVGPNEEVASRVELRIIVRNTGRSPLFSPGV